ATWRSAHFSFFLQSLTRIVCRSMAVPRSRRPRTSTSPPALCLSGNACYICFSDVTVLTSFYPGCEPKARLTRIPQPVGRALVRP
ncbi:hypothetical protein B0H14DRAFT_2959716, partial [Mycena olivaceomarginata]